MLLSPIRLLLLVLLLTVVDSGRVLRRITERARKLQLHKAKQYVMMRTVSGHHPTEHVKEGKIHQPLNHFDHQTTETIPQRFFVNEAFWKRPHGPVFILIGGEGPISEYDVLAGHHVHLAEKHGALLLALEHRFYGESINHDGLETENLSALSSEQTLTDLVSFHRYISHHYGLTHKNTWISFGGFHAGALSAWFRAKFPHLVHGAVAYSAPVKAKLDFSSYNKIVGLSLMNEAVGGSRKCETNVREAFAAVELALMGGNATQVAKDFGACHIPKHLDDQVELMENLAEIIMGAVQYNEEGAVMSIDELCEIMSNKSEAYDEEIEAYHRLAKVAQLYRFTIDEPCLDSSREQSVKALMDTSIKSDAGRQWYYQTCAEYGFYKTCEDASCPFSRMMTLQSQTSLCHTLFDMSQHSLHGRIAFTNTFYGADKPHSHRVLYVNGGIDPWHGLSVVHNKSEEEHKSQVLLIKDLAHCADIMTTGPKDRAIVKKARREIERHVAKWLRSAAWENMKE